jgi:hypothetical protein
MVQFKEYAQQIMKKEEDINRREKALNAYLERRKLTQQAVF